MKQKNKRYAAEGKFAKPLELIADPVFFSIDQEGIVEASKSFEKTVT